MEALEQRRGIDWDWDSNDRQRVSLGDRLREARRLVVLGDPGAGKSTLLRWLATAYLLRLKNLDDWRGLPDIASLPDNDWLPILIRCRDLSPEYADRLEIMLLHTLRKSELPEKDCADLCALLLGKLQRGEALLLVDGLDEITESRARARFAGQLEQIHRAYAQAPMVVTSRIVGYREMGCRIRSGFEHLTVADLSKKNKDDFVRRWCALTERPERRAAAAEELIRDIHASDRIERLTGNPMLLTTMALIKRKIGKLPQRRVELYEKAVEVLLNWRSEVDKPLDRREALPQLEYLAHAMCKDGIQQIREDQALELLRRMREEYLHIHPLRQHSPEEFLSLLERRTGMMIQSGHSRHNGLEVPVYEFRHLTFQEYLAGIALVQGHYQGRDKNKRLAEVIAPLAGQVGDYRFVGNSMVKENWQEALRLCLAACNDDDADAALLAILRPLPGETGTARGRAIQAALCLIDEPNVFENTKNEVIFELIERMKVPIKEAHVIDDELLFDLYSSPCGKILEEYLFDAFFQCKREDECFYGICYSMTMQNSICFEKSSVFIFIAGQAVKKSMIDSDKIYRLFVIFWERLYHRRHRSRIGASVSVTPKLQDVIAEIYAIGDERAVNILKTIYSQDTGENIRRAALGSMAQNCKEETDRMLLSENFGGIAPFLDPQSPITSARVAEAAEKLKQPAEEIAQRYAMLAQWLDLMLAPEVAAAVRAIP
ncbi:MAG: NACHT domain-containing protein [Candidatus Electronema sp. VV]